MSDASSRASSTPKPKAFRRKQRGKFPAKDDFLSDEEIRERELSKMQLQRVTVNIKARQLAIMQETRAALEQANAITKNVRRVA